MERSDTFYNDIADSTMVGLCIKDDDLYFSYRSRRIEQYGSY